MIFVIPVRHTFQSYSHRFVGIDNTSIFGLVFPILRQASSRQFVGVLQGIAAGTGISNFLRTLFHDVLEVLILWFNEEDTSQLCGIIELWLLDSPFFLLSFSLHQTYASTHPATHCRVLKLFFSSSVSPRTMYILLVTFRSIKQIL